MNLVDSYVRAVAKALPQEQREDISRELSEDIRSEMEDRQRELGRELTPPEQEALLKGRGNPLVLAARYRQDQRSLTIGRELIGPVLFPFYVRVLSFNLGLTFVVIGTIFVALSSSGQKIRFEDIFSSALLQLLIQLTVVTLIFSAVQQHLNKYPDRWHLKGMRGRFALDLNIERDIELGIAPENKGWAPAVSRFESLSVIVASAVALLWWTEVQSHPFYILGPGAFFLKLAPVWHQMYLPIVLLTAAEIVRAAVNLARPGWTRFRAVARIVTHAGGLAVLYGLFRAGFWVTLTDAMASRANQYGEAVQVVNQCFYYGLLVGVIWCAIGLALRIVKLVRGWRWQNGASSVGSAAQTGK
jgi:hypothetical protein